jgi:hypothetical protein
MTMPREITNQILDFIEQGILDKDEVIKACLNYMSEDDVRDMAESNEFLPADYDAEDDYDGQPDWAQEWHDFDPDC